MLFVTVPGALGGSNRALLTLLAALEGKVSRVVAAPAEGAMAFTVDDEDLAEHYIGLSYGGGPGRLFRVLNSFRIARWAFKNRESVQVIHANATTGLYMAMPASLITGIPITVWVHDSVSTPWGKRLGRVIGALLRNVEWAAVSSIARDVIVANGLAPPQRVHIVPNPVSEDVVLAADRQAGDGRIRIGFLGAATAAKGFDLLPGVMAETSDLPLTWKLFVNRKDLPEEAPVWDRVDALADVEVEVHGRSHDVRDAYAQCDLIFNPSRFESFSRVTAEALINSIPVVASDIAPMREILGDSDAGALFPVADTIAAGKAIRAIVETAGDLERRSAACRDVDLEVKPSRVAEHMLDLYGSARAGTGA